MTASGGGAAFQRVLDGLAWEAVQAPAVHEVLPYVTHQGVLDLGDVQLTVYQLSNGQRVIDGESLRAAFELWDVEAEG